MIMRNNHIGQKDLSDIPRRLSYSNNFKFAEAQCLGTLKYYLTFLLHLTTKTYDSTQYSHLKLITTEINHDVEMLENCKYICFFLI